jgi:hypothetical protein
MLKNRCLDLLNTKEMEVADVRTKATKQICPFARSLTLKHGAWPVGA